MALPQRGRLPSQRSKLLGNFATPFTLDDVFLVSEVLLRGGELLDMKGLCLRGGKQFRYAPTREFSVNPRIESGDGQDKEARKYM